jgi:ATP-dependent helicase/nuclease subunit A
MEITLLSAGAGSGKTYRLTGEMTKLLQGQVRASGIIATTFTKKAAAELQERVRVKLLEEGMMDAANDLGAAMIGTVHSIGTRLLQRFAFEAGVSPLVEIIADGDGQRLFNESLSQVLTENRIETLNLLADRLGLTKRDKGNSEDDYDWRKNIHDITDVARANNFGIDVLEKSKLLSWQQFERFLPEVKQIDLQTLNNRLSFHLEQAIAAIDNNEIDSTAVTKNAAIEYRNYANQLKSRGELYWHEWVKISKISPGAKSKELVQELKEFALTHDECPQFRTDVKGFIDLVFDIAMQALQEFEQYKKKRGLIDYTDMETYISRLLKNETVIETLKEELDLLLVDEFQDTSPIQLDIFLQLSRLAKHSIWVGDPKQSIYGFRGADPAMMKAIIDQTGGVKPENILDHSWRSREDLVNSVNAIFVKAFTQYPSEQIALNAVRTRDKEPEDMPLAMHHWHFKSDLNEKRVPGKPWLENCISTQIGVILAQKLPILPKNSKEWRPLQAGDIAILCRSNTACTLMAESLHKAGLKASIARAGLMDTAEAKLILACMKYLLSPSDALSVAEIRLLASDESLEAIVDDRLLYLEQVKEVEADSNAPKAVRWAEENPILLSLNELRPRTADLSASEILNMVVDELDLRRIVIQFGNAPQRLDNVDRLRAYALDYESACTRLHSAASLGGFLLWLAQLGSSGGDTQGSGESPDAIKVLTYHKSKGLEYPLTICHNLDGKLRENIWGVNLVAETREIDLDNILGNRWLRFWVNPYNDQLGTTRLESNLHLSDEWKLATQQALEEEARLLYVGLTRARDYLVFPTTVQPTKWLNRVFNKGDETTPTLLSFMDETPFYWKDRVVNIANQEVYMAKDFPTVKNEEGVISFHADRLGKKLHYAHRIDPYNEMADNSTPNVGEPIVFAPTFEIETWNEDQIAAIQKVLQSIFLADSLKLKDEDRINIVHKQLEIRQIDINLLNSSFLLAQSSSFLTWIKNDLQPLQLDRCMTLKTMLQNRLLEIEVDFIVTTQTEIIVLKYQSSTTANKGLKIMALANIPLLGWLKKVLPTVDNQRVRLFFVSVMEGSIVEVF